jgi:NitT/TauT family transport system permease protein
VTVTRNRAAGPGRALLWQVICFAVAVAIWSLVRAANLVSAGALPGPLAVLRALLHLVPSGDFWTYVGLTLRGALVGLAAAALVGIPLGLVTGAYPAAERASRLLVDVLRTFPVIALLPVFILILGATPTMKATIIFLACVFPIFLQTQYGARGVSPTITETVRAYQIPRLLRFRKVILPAAVPSVMTGLRLAATTSVLVSIGVELLSTVHGLGFALVQEQQAGNSAIAFGYIFVAGGLGYGINKLFEVAERLILRWRPPTESD